MDRSINRVPGTCRKAGLAALLALAGSASAADSVLSMVPDQSVIMPGGSVEVNAFARFPTSGFAMASVGFDAMQTMSKGWKDPSSGVVLGAGVLGASWSQPHNPFGGPIADNANPMRVWHATFVPPSYDPALVTFAASVDGFEYYPSPLTPSSVPATPRVTPGHVLVNPLSVGPVLVAPGEGTTLEPTGPGSIAAASEDEEVLIGLLLPAVQKVREAASRSSGNFTLQLHGRPAGSGGDDMPTETVSFYFNQVPGTATMQVQFNRPGAYAHEACAIGASGVWICLIESQPAGTVTFASVPDSFSFGVEREMKESGEKVGLVLEWDEPTTLTIGNQTADGVTRLHLATISPGGTSLPAVQAGAAEFITYTGLEQPSAAFVFEPKCRADMTSGAVPGMQGYGMADGILNNDDFFYFLAQFAGGNLQAADLTGVATPGQPGYGVPDGALNNEDFFFYLALFSQGC